MIPDALPLSAHLSKDYLDLSIDNQAERKSYTCIYLLHGSKTSR